MKELIVKIDMKLMQGPTISYVDQPGNRGTTCMALIETSHIVIHIWDEPNPGVVQLDIYSCKEFNLSTVIHHLEQYFNVCNMQYKFLDRTTGMTVIDERLKLSYLILIFYTCTYHIYKRQTLLYKTLLFE